MSSLLPPLTPRQALGSCLRLPRCMDTCILHALRSHVLWGEGWEVRGVASFHSVSLRSVHRAGRVGRQVYMVDGIGQ